MIRLRQKAIAQHVVRIVFYRAGEYSNPTSEDIPSPDIESNGVLAVDLLSVNLVDLFSLKLPLIMDQVDRGLIIMQSICRQRLTQLVNLNYPQAILGGNLCMLIVIEDVN